MNLSDLDFELPQELIAQNPVEPRDSARLLVYRRDTGEISHKYVSDLPSLLPKDTVLVANSSKVRKGRLKAKRQDGKEIELLVLGSQAEGLFECMIGGKGCKTGDTLTLSNHHSVTIKSTIDEASFTTFLIDFHCTTEEAEEIIEQIGSTPLPPYITDSQAPDSRYQTIYADTLGSAAAPTAGLHFTERLLEELKKQGHAWEEVILHVGMGTFQPLRHENVTDNTLHHEDTYISEEVATRLNSAKQIGLPIMAIGTTSCRTLESHSQPEIVSGSLSTSLFIYPGYKFKSTTILFTNFHLPKSSLLLLVSAFLSENPDTALTTLHRIYSEAIQHQYRFFSFGDAMLIL